MGPKKRQPRNEMQLCTRRGLVATPSKERPGVEGATGRGAWMVLFVLCLYSYNSSMIHLLMVSIVSYYTWKCGELKLYFHLYAGRLKTKTKKKERKEIKVIC